MYRRSTHKTTCIHNRGAHAFVEKDTGKVYKGISWNQPAKGYRYDMRIDQHRELLHNPKFVDWAGGYLYRGLIKR